eukprot:SM000011S18993  [mRNA]  locus=s11:239897:244077:+ [translate_table: standard]
MFLRTHGGGSGSCALAWRLASREPVVLLTHQSRSCRRPSRPVCMSASPASGTALPGASPRPFVGDLGVRSGFVEAIGNTPLIRLNRASEATGCDIYGKAEAKLSLVQQAAQAEFANPGGSVKDRAALYIIKDAEERGLLAPGGVVVEGTAGNTGIGLALVANARGYRTVIVIPDTQSQAGSLNLRPEKKDMLRIAGATLVEVCQDVPSSYQFPQPPLCLLPCNVPPRPPLASRTGAMPASLTHASKRPPVQVPAVPYKNPNNYVKYSGRLAEALARTSPSGAVWGNQVPAPAFGLLMRPPGSPTLFDNQANRRAHYETTGPEIWAQTSGKVDAFVCAIGTGGTLAGVGKYLKEQNPAIRIGMADPMGASMYSYYATGVLQSSGTSITEGIGQGRVTGNLEGWGVPERDGGVVDFWCQSGQLGIHTLLQHDAEVVVTLQVADDEALPLVYDLLQQEGLCMGGSTGINIGGAVKLAKELGPGHTIITILCDFGTRCQSRLFNVDFLKSKGLPVPRWMETTKAPNDLPVVFEAV